jgi:NTP pyrophosphatase (non-canonical NTP hydrolase)
MCLASTEQGNPGPPPRSGAMPSFGPTLHSELSTIHVLVIMDPRLVAFERLLDIMDTLRAECPWDRKQTMETLRPLTIEETYELGDAILKDDLQEVKKELGDLLLHMVFYAKIGQEKGAFDITEVLNGICEKLIHRHPHIYGDVKVTGDEEVKANWEKIKLAEKVPSTQGAARYHAQRAGRCSAGLTQLGEGHPHPGQGPWRWLRLGTPRSGMGQGA